MCWLLLLTCYVLFSWFSSWSVNDLRFRWNHFFLWQADGFALRWFGRSISPPSIQQENLQTQFSFLGHSSGVLWIHKAYLAAELLKKAWESIVNTQVYWSNLFFLLNSAPFSQKNKKYNIGEESWWKKGTTVNTGWGLIICLPCRNNLWLLMNTAGLHTWQGSLWSAHPGQWGPEQLGGQGPAISMEEGDPVFVINLAGIFLQQTLLRMPQHPTSLSCSLGTEIQQLPLFLKFWGMRQNRGI